MSEEHDDLDPDEILIYQLRQALALADQRMAIERARAIEQLDAFARSQIGWWMEQVNAERRKVAEEILDLHRCFEGAKNQNEFEDTVRGRYLQGIT